MRSQTSKISHKRHKKHKRNKTNTILTRLIRMLNGRPRRFGESSADRRRHSKLAARLGKWGILRTSKRDRTSTPKRRLVTSIILRLKLRTRQCLFPQHTRLRRNISRDKASIRHGRTRLQIQAWCPVSECRSVVPRRFLTRPVTSASWCRCSSCFSSLAKKSKFAFTPHRL